MRILFLCLGNICRSPAAEAVFGAMARAAGLPVNPAVDLAVDLDSAGTGGWHAGEPPYPPMQAAARARGYDLSALRARQIAPADFGRFDLILAMDRQNLRDARDLAQGPTRARLELFLPDGEDVPNPYYSRDFDGCLDVIERGSRALLKRLQPAQ